MKRFVITGGALSGNKGAAGMVIALMQNLSIRYPGARFTLMSYYPKSDQRINHYPNLEIVSATPLALMLLFPITVMAFLVRIFHLPLGALKQISAIRAIIECDLYLEAAGVSFVDGREKFLPLNILWLFLPLALGKPIVKVSQAIGPFKNPINRVLAKVFLPRVRLICARGRQTEAFLLGLGIRNYKVFPDAAFSLNLTDAREDLRQRYVFPRKGKSLVGISPSQVVYGKCLRKGIDYPAVMARFVEHLISERYDVVLIPHSVREGSIKTRNNDLPVLEKIYDRMTSKDAVCVVREELTPSELRILIGQLDFFVASRFHAMISALCMKVPTLVFGWSHKYAEVLDDFELSETALDYSNLSPEIVLDGFSSLEKGSLLIKGRIERHLEAVLFRARRFYDEISSIMRN
jgi:polysaccharide pyruvyl transferase WcaK-like protein